MKTAQASAIPCNLTPAMPTASKPTKEQLDALANLPELFTDKGRENTPTPTGAGSSSMASKNVLPMQADTLEALKIKCSDAKHALTVAIDTDSRKAIDKALKDAKEAEKAYNDALLCKLFDAFLLEETPIMAYFKQGYYAKMSITATQTKDGMTANLSETSTVLDIQRFMRHAGTRTVVKRSDWFAICCQRGQR